MGGIFKPNNPWNPVNVLNPFSGNNPVTGQPGMGFFGEPKPGFDPHSGQPLAPEYSPSYDKNTMSMTGELDSRLAANKLDNRGLDKFRGEAMRDGPSAWAGLANAQQDKYAIDGANKASAAAAGQTAGAQSNLAMRGGINSGARERVQAAGAQNALNMGQDVRNQAANNKLQIGINDEQNRITQLGQLPNMDIAAHGAGLQDINAWGQGKQFDIHNQIGEGNAKNLFNSQRYKDQMAAWGAGKTADATAASGKKS